MSTRLTQLEFEGGSVLYDVLSVLQRAELVTRMAVEVERYIVELGTEGRLIEMQLEETMVGVAADKAALIRDYSVEDTEDNLSTILASIARMPHQDLLDFGRLAELLGYDRKVSTLDFPVSPRGYRVLGRIPRLKLVVQRIIKISAGSRRSWRRATGTSRRSRESAPVAPRTSARAYGDFKRSTRSTGTAELTAPSGVSTKERPIPDLTEQVLDEASVADLEIEAPLINFEVGDNVVYPHHGAGVVLKKETKDLMGEKRDYLTINILHNNMTVMVPCENAHRGGPPSSDRRGAGQEGDRGAHRRGLRDAEELESPVQAQPREDQDRRRLRARGGGPQPRHSRVGEGTLHRREADVHARRRSSRPSSCTRWTRTRTARRPTWTSCSRSASALPRRPPSSASAVIAAAGSGSDSEPAAHFIELAGRPMLEWSLEAFRAAPRSTRSSSRLHPGTRAGG